MCGNLQKKLSEVGYRNKDTEKGDSLIKKLRESYAGFRNINETVTSLILRLQEVFIEITETSETSTFIDFLIPQTIIYSLYTAFCQLSIKLREKNRKRDFEDYIDKWLVV